MSLTSNDLDELARALAVLLATWWHRRSSSDGVTSAAADTQHGVLHLRI